VAKTGGGLQSVCLHAEVSVCFMWTSWHVWIFRWRLSDQRAPGREVLDSWRGEGIRERGREGSLWLQQLAAGAKKPNRRLISRVTQLWEPSRRICRRAIWSIDGNKAGDIADRPVVFLQLCSTAKTTDVLLNSSPKTGKRKGKFIYYYYYLFTYLLHGVGSFLRSYSVYSCVLQRRPQTFC